MKDHITIFVNGRRHDVGGADVFKPLTDWLRDDLHLSGTKVVCAEGDCGSCTLLVGRVQADTLKYKPVCGCIQYLFQLDASHVVTIEGLKYDGQLNPIQEAFVACHGAQCGFCTPGFIVAMHHLLQQGRPEADAVKRGLTGNLCRCTGYEPIIAAAAAVPEGTVRSIDALYPPGPIKEVLVDLAGDATLVTAGAQAFFKPVTLQQAVEFRAGNPGCAIVAGGTDIGVQMNKRTRSPAAVLSTAALPAWGDVTVEPSHVTFGAGATLCAVQSALEDAIPELSAYLEWFGSPQIRHAGTLAGNLANASPIGDMIPPLMVLEAEIVIAGTGGERSVNLNDFYTGYRQTVLHDDELIARIRVPLPVQGDLFRVYKASKRKDLDISTFSMAARMRLNGGRMTEIRLAMGGVGPTVVRLRKTETALRGRMFDEAAIEAVSTVVRSEITPISDVRGSSDYRNLLAVNVLKRMQQEITAEANSASPAQEA